MHSCPDCDQACYCSGDIEDHDTGEEFLVECCCTHEGSGLDEDGNPIDDNFDPEQFE
jgi:hypothetical protein